MERKRKKTARKSSNKQVLSGTQIRLKFAWALGSEIYSGGFGRIFEASGDKEEIAVIKLIPKEPGAARELLFESVSGLPNILPILDSGEWDDYYVLVMPRADKSLRQYLQGEGGRLKEGDAIKVLTDVANGLASLSAEVVHRDLKPENVLLFQGDWHIADFGIARYLEATTSRDTRKHAMTPPYASPEQWRGERATGATDIYAFGVMAFELLAGRLPFAGPNFHEQHLNMTPPYLDDVAPGISTIVTECLSKSSGSRPSASNIVARLKANPVIISGALKDLQQANLAVTRRKAEESARESAWREKERKREAIFKDGLNSVNRIFDSLRSLIFEAASRTKERIGVLGAREFILGNGILSTETVTRASEDCLRVRDDVYEAPFDVVAYSEIKVQMKVPNYNYLGRSHSLWLCDAEVSGVYRWYELSFMMHPFARRSSSINPFALSPDEKSAGVAFTPGMDVTQLAWKPRPFDQGAENQFIDRWIKWLADASSGLLRLPHVMPDNSEGGFRHPERRGK